MEKNMLARLKPHDPKKGLLLKQYTYQGIRFQAGRGWYRVNRKVAAYLEGVHSVPGDEDTPLAFDVCTPDEARAMDEKDRKAARQVLPAEEALDVSHVGDEQPRAKSRPSPDRDDAPRRQRRDSDRLPENVQADALDDEDVEDEISRRRPSRRRAGVVSRRPRAVVEDFDDNGDPDEDELEEDASRRRTLRRRAGAVSRRPRAVVEDFDEPDDGEFNDDEFDDEDEAFEDEAPGRRARRNRAGAVPRRRLRADDVDDFDDEDLDDEVEDLDDDELDEEFEEDAEDAPAPPRRRRNLPPRSRASRARRMQRYAVEHDALDDDDRLIRGVRGPRQAEALDALRIREARRARRRVPEEAVGSELDDEPTQKLSGSRSQERHQDELHIRHARQMAAKLEQSDALDDAMSYGDAEDSLPNEARRNRHGGHGDAEDSLPNARSQHVSQRDAEDSLPGKGARNRHSGHGDAEDSLSMRSRHSDGDAEDSLPHCDRRKQQDAPSSRHTADAQDDLDAVDPEPDRRNVEESARSDARSQHAQQPPSSAAHDELDALDDALDDDLEKASEDQRPGSAQPRHGQQRTGSSQPRDPKGAHDATSGADARDERRPWPENDPFVNRDTHHQGPTPGHEPVAAASPRQGRRIYIPGANAAAAPMSGEKPTAPQPGRQRRNA